MNRRISVIRAREILSAGAFPTIDTMVTLENGLKNSASVPFGTSAGRHEAATLLDHDATRYCGFGMLTAVQNVNDIIGPMLKGCAVDDQRAIDEKLATLDTTPRRQRIGGNAILSVSLACCRVAAQSAGSPLYRYIRDTYGRTSDIRALPRPMVVMIEGGRHADESTDLQEYMVAALPGMNTRDSVRAAIEVYLRLGRVLKERGYSVNVGYEGAYAPAGIRSNEEPLQHIERAIREAGYVVGRELALAMDPAASELQRDDGLYHLATESRAMTGEALVAYYEELAAKYAICSIEDGLGEDDWAYWPLLNRQLGPKIMIVGDDLTVTNVERLRQAIECKAINAVLIKPNQVGTLSETMAAIAVAERHGMKVVVSHRGGGETTDTFMVDLGVASDAEFIKVGPSRGERVIKYNRLMEIADELGF